MPSVSVLTAAGTACQTQICSLAPATWSVWKMGIAPIESCTREIDQQDVAPAKPRQGAGHPKLRGPPQIYQFVFGLRQHISNVTAAAVMATARRPWISTVVCWRCTTTGPARLLQSLLDQRATRPALIRQNGGSSTPAGHAMCRRGARGRGILSTSPSSQVKPGRTESFPKQGDSCP